MAEWLEFVEAALDQVALLVEPLAVGDAVMAVGLWRNVRLALLVFERLPDPVCVIPLSAITLAPAGRSLSSSSAMGASFISPGESSN